MIWQKSFQRRNSPRHSPLRDCLLMTLPVFVYYFINDSCVLQFAGQEEYHGASFPNPPTLISPNFNSTAQTKGKALVVIKCTEVTWCVLGALNSDPAWLDGERGCGRSGWGTWRPRSCPPGRGERSRFSRGHGPTPPANPLHLQQ